MQAYPPLLPCTHVPRLLALRKSPSGPEKYCCYTVRNLPLPLHLPSQKIESPLRGRFRQKGSANDRHPSRKDDKKHSIMAPTSADPAGDLALQVLQALANTDQILSTEAFPSVPFETLKASLDRLSSRSMVVYEQIERQEAILEAEA